jgi:predicted nucleotidyltransferase
MKYIENVENKLPKNTINFFNKLQEYIDCKIYFYGSLLRADYIPDKSDIDVCIFTDNEFSTMTKMQHYLHINKNDFEKVIWKFTDEYVVYGYKLKYNNPEEKIIAEFSIYNSSFKENIMSNHEFQENIPFFILIFLYILKIGFYKLNIMDGKTYSKIKGYILQFTKQYPNEQFWVLK